MKGLWPFLMGRADRAVAAGAVPGTGDGAAQVADAERQLATTTRRHHDDNSTCLRLGPARCWPSRLPALLAAAPAHAQFQERTLPRLQRRAARSTRWATALAKMGACTLEKTRRQDEDRSRSGTARSATTSPATQSVRTGSLDMVLTSTAPLVGHRAGAGRVRPAVPVRQRAAKPTRCSTARSATGSPPSCRRSAWSTSPGGRTAFATPPTRKRPITKVEDFDGVKMRVMQNNIFIDTFKTLGSNAVPMAFSEVYSALETKTVDGQENPFANIENIEVLRGAEVPHADQARVQPATLVLFSSKTWDTLSPAGAGRAARLRRRRAATSSAASTASRPSAQRGQPEGQGHAGQRDRAGRDAAHPRQGRA